MKTLIPFLICSLLIHQAVQAQNPAINTLQTAGGTGEETISQLVSDNNSGFVAVGTFSGNLSLGNLNAASVAGGTDIFIARLNSNHQVVWAKTFGNACNDHAASVASGPDGTLVVTGSFYGTLSVDGTTIYAAGSKDGFLASFDPYGTLNWIQAFGGAGSDEGVRVQIANDGSIYLAASMDQSDFANADQPSNGLSAHVVKFNSQGTLLWSNCESAVGPGSIIIRDMTLDTSMHVYVTGSYSGQVQAGDGGTLLLLSPTEQFFAAAYTPAGQTTFITTLPQFNGATNTGKAIAATPSGTVLIAGNHQGNISFNGTGYLATDADIFVAELTASGTLIWGKAIAAAGYQSAEALAVDAASNWAICGYFLNDFIAQEFSLTNLGATDGFLLAGTGNTVSGAVGFGGPGIDVNNAVVCGAEGFITSGYFSSGTNDAMTAGPFTALSNGNADCFHAGVSLNQTLGLPGAENSRPSFSFWPNPAHESIQVAFDSGSTMVEISIHAVTGALVARHPLSGGMSQRAALDLSGLSPGLYHITLEDQKGRTTARLIVD